MTIFKINHAPKNYLDNIYGIISCFKILFIIMDYGRNQMLSFFLFMQNMLRRIHCLQFQSSLCVQRFQVQLTVHRYGLQSNLSEPE